MADNTERARLAERLIGDIDALDAKRNLAVYECDARLVARWYLALAAELEAAEDRVRSYKLLAEQRHEKIRKLENSSLSERSRDVLVAVEKRVAARDARVKSLIDDAVYSLAVGESKIPRPDTATRQLRQALAALALAASAEETPE